MEFPNRLIFVGRFISWGGGGGLVASSKQEALASKCGQKGSLSFHLDQETSCCRILGFPEPHHHHHHQHRLLHRFDVSIAADLEELFGLTFSHFLSFPRSYHVM